MMMLLTCCDESPTLSGRCTPLGVSIATVRLTYKTMSKGNFMQRYVEGVCASRVEGWQQRRVVDCGTCSPTAVATPVDESQHRVEDPNASSFDFMTQSVLRIPKTTLRSGLVLLASPLSETKNTSPCKAEVSSRPLFTLQNQRVRN